MSKGNKKRVILPNIFRGRVIVAVLIVVQLAGLVFLALEGAQYSKYLGYFLNAVSIAVSLIVVYRDTNYAYKLIWVYLILAFPIFGGLFYLIFSLRGSMRRIAPLMKDIEGRVPIALEECSERAVAAYPERVNQIKYLSEHCGFPISGGTETRFFATGEEFYPALLEALESAERFIFLEYFIIGEGKMWDSVLDVLKRKAREGVDVRLLYDDFGCIFLLPKSYPERLEEYGIKCRAFNRFRPLLTGLQNSRDHRKICVVDGRIAFTGGINLADEYINEIEKYGRWKDSAVSLTGEAARGFSAIFLRMWMLTSPDESEYGEELSELLGAGEACGDDGFVITYCDSPLDTDQVCERIYLQMINGARRYLYVCTPYLIIDDGMVDALKLAAQSGVDVRIITPHKWDKRMVHITTRSYYRELIEGGVRIYEYTPGFIHSKVLVSDDEVASVGTANLDFRSLYLHFECGALFFGSQAVIQARDDFLATLNECREIKREDCREGLAASVLHSILRLIAPLL